MRIVEEFDFACGIFGFALHRSLNALVHLRQSLHHVLCKFEMQLQIYIKNRMHNNILWTIIAFDGNTSCNPSANRQASIHQQTTKVPLKNRSILKVQCRIALKYSAALHFIPIEGVVRRNRHRRVDKQALSDRLFGEVDWKKLCPSVKESLPSSSFFPLFLSNLLILLIHLQADWELSRPKTLKNEALCLHLACTKPRKLQTR